MKTTLILAAAAILAAIIGLVPFFVSHLANTSPNNLSNPTNIATQLSASPTPTATHVTQAPQPTYTDVQEIYSGNANDYGNQRNWTFTLAITKRKQGGSEVCTQT